MPTPITYRSPLLSYFEYSHLPVHLQAISQPFAQLAQNIDSALAGELYLYAQRKRRELRITATTPADRAQVDAIPNAQFIDLERLPENLRAAHLQSEAAIAKLLEAKDCAVRAGLSIVKAAKECEHTPPITVTANGTRISFTRDTVEYSELVASLNMHGDPSVTVKRPNGAGFALSGAPSITR